MSDILEKVSGNEDFIRKIFSKIPAFRGYFEREDRRAADKILREAIADRFEALWGRISSMQRDVIAEGQIELIDDLESSAIKIRQFIDRIRTASYGYAGFFDAVRINKEELDQIYQYDLELLDLEDAISNAIDNISSSFGTEGLPAAVRHLSTLSQNCLDAFNKREETIMNMSSDAPEQE